MALTRSAGPNRAQLTAKGPGGFALAGLETGISLRDRHMREKYLEVACYPEAVLTVPRASLKFPADGQRSSADVDGTMTSRGRTAPARFHYDATNDSLALARAGSPAKARRCC